MSRTTYDVQLSLLSYSYLLTGGVRAPWRIRVEPRVQWQQGEALTLMRWMFCISRLERGILPSVYTDSPNFVVSSADAAQILSSFVRSYNARNQADAVGQYAYISKLSSHPVPLLADMQVLCIMKC